MYACTQIQPQLQLFQLQTQQTELQSLLQKVNIKSILVTVDQRVSTALQPDLIWCIYQCMYEPCPWLYSVEEGKEPGTYCVCMHVNPMEFHGDRILLQYLTLGQSYIDVLYHWRIQNSLAVVRVGCSSLFLKHEQKEFIKCILNNKDVLLV